MGYGAYDTARGMAGYMVDDTCHTDGCDESIDRGLEYLCGTDPHSPDPGCGWWFCSTDLFVFGEDGCGYLCKPCLEATEEAP